MTEKSIILKAIQKEEESNKRNYEVYILSMDLRILKDAVENDTIEDLIAKDGYLKKNFDRLLKRHQIPA